jgi:hypothetical protein
VGTCFSSVLDRDPDLRRGTGWSADQRRPRPAPPAQPFDRATVAWATGASVLAHETDDIARRLIVSASVRADDGYHAAQRRPNASLPSRIIEQRRSGRIARGLAAGGQGLAPHRPQDRAADHLRQLRRQAWFGGMGHAEVVTLRMASKRSTPCAAPDAYGQPGRGRHSASTTVTRQFRRSADEDQQFDSLSERSGHRSLPRGPGPSQIGFARTARGSPDPRVPPDARR